MNAPTEKPCIAGYQARLAGTIEIEKWTPPSRAAVEAMPPLPPPLVRGWKLEEPDLPPAAPPPAQEPAPPPTSPAPCAAPGKPEPSFFLKEVAAHLFAPFLAKEYPQTIALTLAQLDPAQAADVLAQLDLELRADVAYRLATLEYVSPLDLKWLEEGLEMSLGDVLKGSKVGGPEVVAEILKRTEVSVEKEVLAQIESRDPKVAGSVRSLMFTFDDLARLTDREIQTLLREVDQKDLVTALKIAGQTVMEKILSNMSEEMRTFIAQEVEYLPQMRLGEVEEVQRRILQKARALEEKGQITTVRGRARDEIV